MIFKINFVEITKRYIFAKNPKKPNLDMFWPKKWTKNDHCILVAIFERNKKLKNVIMATFKILLGSQRKDGIRQVYVRLSHNGTREKVKIPFVATAKQVGKTGDISDTRLLVTIYNVIQQMQDGVAELGVAGLGMTAREIADAVWYKKYAENDKDFRLDWMEWLDVVIEEKKKRPGRTWESYRSAKVAYGRYMKARRIERMDINDIKKQTLIDFMEWMAADGIGPRGREAYMSNLASAHNMAKRRYNDEDEDTNNISRSPFANIEYKIPAQDKNAKKKYALDSEQMRWLWEAPVPTTKRVKRARDTFFMSFALCGMNSCDMFDLPKSSDRTRIVYDRRKTIGRTGESSHIELEVPKEIQHVVDAYDGRRSFFCYQDELGSDQSMNKTVNEGLKLFLASAAEYYSDQWNVGLSEAKKRLGVCDEVTYYTARHSWASIAANECHVRMDLIDRCLCHVTDSVAARSYVKRVYDEINEANAMVVAKVMGR